MVVSSFLYHSTPKFSTPIMTLLLSGHPSCAKTYDLIQCDFSWPGMQRFICSYVTSCKVCQCIKNRTHKPYGLLQPLDIPDQPWYSISRSLQSPTLSSWTPDQTLAKNSRR